MIHGVRAFVPLLVEQNEGHVVNVSSMQGLVATRSGGPYTVSKQGVVALSEVLFHDLAAARSDVGVSVVCPGAVQTRIYESERNRPEGMPVEALRTTPMRQGADVRRMLAGGLTPDLVAGQIVDAIRTRRFYVLTHPAAGGRRPPSGRGHRRRRRSPHPRPLTAA